MKKRTRIFAILIVLIMIASTFAACGSGASAANYSMTDTAQAAGESMPQAVSEDGMNFGSEEMARNTDTQRKIILNATLEIEALDFDVTCTALLKALNDSNGHVASTSINTPSYEGARRSATYELRVPADQYDSFLASAGEAGNVTSKWEDTEDITAQYVDVEARLKSLKTQEERLYDMMEQAGELETLLAIQNQLTDVQYQIESYTAQQRTYDDLVDYSTVTVYIEEVQRVTENPDSFIQRIGAAFAGSWDNFGDGLQDFVIAAIYFLPTLLVLIVLALIIRAIARFFNRNKAIGTVKKYRKEKKAAMPQETTAPDEEQDSANLQ